MRSWRSRSRHLVMISFFRQIPLFDWAPRHNGILWPHPRKYSGRFGRVQHTLNRIASHVNLACIVMCARGVCVCVWWTVCMFDVIRIFCSACNQKYECSNMANESVCMHAIIEDSRSRTKSEQGKIIIIIYIMEMKGSSKRRKKHDAANELFEFRTAAQDDAWAHCGRICVHAVACNHSDY